jgi:hypothetical protein|tara:strand:- start:236 stop:358 length:123 start_codon:yes stop_codon:yes gene_type:complete
VYRREINARGWDALSENLSSCTIKARQKAIVNRCEEREKI